MSQRVGFDRSVVEAAVEVASRAPSIHNTQPWAWALRNDVLELRADHARQLTVADPDGHSLRISCGAALHLTALALRAGGCEVTTQRRPDDADPALLARFTDPRAVEPADEDRADAEAALGRRSDRRPFSADSVSEETIEVLRAAAEGGGVFAHFPTRPDEQLDLAVALSWADRVEQKDEAYIAEMQRWIHDTDVNVDGIPASAVPRVETGHPRRTNIPLRDFELGVPGQLLIAQDVDEHPLIAVLLSEYDSPGEQLEAGEAMMRLMIRAARAGIATCPLSQAVDLLALRARIRTLMGWTGYPQMMLRLGYPPESDAPVPRTPRRPLADVLHVA
ncbi:MAG TPA: nitroreductase family protein [Jatrophihabitans sp.]|nr:nitroreductase family protein [Jatrophihabitans sp.]